MLNEIEIDVIMDETPANQHVQFCAETKKLI
jgi:hypothetical protein